MKLCTGLQQIMCKFSNVGNCPVGTKPQAHCQKKLHAHFRLLIKMYFIKEKALASWTFCCMPKLHFDSVKNFKNLVIEYHCYIIGLLVRLSNVGGCEQAVLHYFTSQILSEPLWVIKWSESFVQNCSFYTFHFTVYFCTWDVFPYLCYIYINTNHSNPVWIH